ncbi:MAG: FixH family protein [Candidatus Competibacterales bacterium]
MDLLLSLAGGVVAVVVINGLLLRYTALSSPVATLLVVLVTLGLYFPWTLLHWPGGDVVAIHLALYTLAAGVSGLFFHQFLRIKAADKPRFHWGPATICGFFAVLIGVDSVLLVLADRGLPGDVIAWLMPEPRLGEGRISMGFPGVVARDFHEKEAQFNAYLAERRRQAQRGWQVRKGWLATPVVGETAVFQVEVVDPQGAPVSGAEVVGDFMRPSDHTLDRAFAMEEVDPGRYRVALTLPEPGRWQLLLEIDKAGERHEVQATTTVAVEVEAAPAAS